ncbi:PREDICTED: uncharacterized protein LOC105955035 [Erythranthe guttata]|uniref:uncharacterized protein LOC105955035 n=1 Tax=Erythranthe guttata TaxID=4155 RepID=UPI00064DE3C8|nr:PREDICTED: uncharacterized protein LOC105955035 [Erythranthe guttata]|eukprot:XP_012834187.1 PREDICTED: uncharacterized protein LOC105955035 [Erythranthe guttata]
MANRRIGKTIPCSAFSVFILLLSSATSQSQPNQGIDIDPSRNIKEQHPEVHCSRERSRAAWKIIEEYLIPFMEKEKYQLSSRCRLHQSNDIFREQEEHKIHVDINEYRSSRTSRMVSALEKAPLEDGYVSYPWEHRMHEMLSVPNSSTFYSINCCSALASPPSGD